MTAIQDNDGNGLSTVRTHCYETYIYPLFDTLGMTDLTTASQDSLTCHFFETDHATFYIFLTCHFLNLLCHEDSCLLGVKDEMGRLSCLVS